MPSSANPANPANPETSSWGGRDWALHSQPEPSINLGSVTLTTGV